ncbi:MAG: MalY/PatB family protein [Anaerolineae bacterium]
MNNAPTAHAADAFDFDRIIDRTHTNSAKWQRYGEDVLPMWVADMDFRSPPALIRALHDRVEHGVFGYPGIPEDLREIIAERLARLYDWKVGPDAITFLPGIVAGFNLATQALVSPQEGLMIQTPVYMHIRHAAEVAGVRGSAMSLSLEADGHYTIDFDAFERTIEDHTKMFLLCNPHNPVGRVFTRSELERMAEICMRHNVSICSDEIHCDLIYNDHRHIPIAALAPEIAEKTVTLMAPSKTFNIAGLHCGFAVIPNAELRRRYRKAGKGLMGTPNLLGYTAARAAYREGQAWLDALLAYLEDNRDLLVKYVEAHLPQLRVKAPEGTFLAWIDCRKADLPTSPHRFFLEEARVAMNEGAAFGPGGEGFVRLNFGCPRELLLEGLGRIRHAMDGV